jgi:hypothetical protein
VIANAAAAAFDYAAADPSGAVNGAVRVAGRMSGMSGPDVATVQQTGFPAWTWLAIGGIGGFLLGVWVCSKHPGRLPSWLPGRSTP